MSMCDLGDGQEIRTMVCLNNKVFVCQFYKGTFYCLIFMSTRHRLELSERREFQPKKSPSYLDLRHFFWLSFFF